MNKVFASLRRGLQQAIRHRRGQRVRRIKLANPTDQTRALAVRKSSASRKLAAIRSREQYLRYRQEAHRLVRRDPDPKTREGARLMRLAALIETYEKKRFMIPEREIQL